MSKACLKYSGESTLVPSLKFKKCFSPKSIPRLFSFEISILKQYFWKEHTFWSDGYFVASIGSANEKTIQKYIEDEIAEMLLRSEVLPGQTIKVDAKKDGLKFTVQTKKIKNTNNN